jgi:tight adherence protein C
VIAATVVVAWRAGAPIRHRRCEAAAIQRALPDALDLLVLAVRAGLTPRQAVDVLARRAPAATRPAFAAVVHGTERGLGFADALASLPDVLGPVAAPVADVIATGERHGLPLAPMLDQLATEARDTRRRANQAAARTLPVRLSFPLVMCTLPSFVLLAVAPAVIAALSSLGGSAW